MSATNAPFGFRPAFHPSGQIRATAYKIATGYGTAIYSGDVVKLVDGGTIELNAAGGAGTLGIFAGVEYTDSLGKPCFSKYWPASTAATNIVAWVYDDPGIIFEAQFTNAASGTTVQTEIGELVDHVAGTGSATTGISGAYLGATGDGGNTVGFRIVGFAGRSEDTLTDAYVVMQCRINDHLFSYPNASI